MIRIRNISKAELIFVGGRLLPDEEKMFPNELALKILKRNPRLLTGTYVEEVKAEETKAPAVTEVIEVVAEEVKAEETKAEEKHPPMKTKRKRK